MVNRFSLQDIFFRVASRVARHAKPFARPLSPFTSRRGFTLIEILVASLLLGMLMTILTMVFNSSSIAWRTGRASNSKMSKARYQLAQAQYLAENALPRVDTANKSSTGRILGAWDKDGELRGRAVDVIGSFPFSLPGWSSNPSVGDAAPKPWAEVTGLQNLQNQSGRSYLVGVHSWGPDGKQDTQDDIDTMPVAIQ